MLSRLSAGLFSLVHGHNLIYNACWEDPVLDRAALDFQSSDRVLVITSAGCNALDYLLAGAGEVHAVDLNPRQNALLELKVAAIQNLDYPRFFALFGQGNAPQVRTWYQQELRSHLSKLARFYWDRHIGFFAGQGLRRSFYHHATNGLFAWLLLTYARAYCRVGEAIDEALTTSSLDDQRAIYETRIAPKFWTRNLKWFLARHTPFMLLGVPWPQRMEIVNQYPGGTAQFSQDCIEAVFTRIPLANNYFWRVYLQGRYTPSCCPEYLKEDSFERLRKGLLSRLHWHTCSVTEMLNHAEGDFSKLVLLDHMDWMSCHYPKALAEEWTAILAKARPGARVIFRSAGLQVSYLDNLPVRYDNQQVCLGDLLTYQKNLANHLHRNDRTQIYGGFYIADLPGSPVP